MPEQSGEGEEVFMVEEVPGDIDTRVAQELAARGGYVHREGGSYVAYTPIGRAYDLFRKLFRRATNKNPPPD